MTRDHLLKGAEGTGFYESGWHRQKVGRIRKLIAYAPVRFIDRPGFPSKLILITEEVNRLEKMLGEVKDITCRAPPHFQEGRIDAIVRRVVELMEENLKIQQIELRLELDRRDEAPLCLFDPNQIQQVLMNLIKNAAEALPGGGTVKTRTYREGDYEAIEIEDNGKGISPEHLREIFNPFFTTKQKGTGLGLAVSLKIIEDHCGDIRVASEVGRGTIFKMRLPRSPSNRVGQEEARPSKRADVFPPRT